MRHIAKKSFFIGNLTGFNRRQSHPGALEAVSHLSTSAAVNRAVSEYHRELAECVRVGDYAQSIRSRAGLEAVSQRILELPLGSDAYYIGRYYEALSINRQGPEAFPRSSAILTEVADCGPLLIRAKAHVALATNQSLAGDMHAAAKLYAEATKIAASCDSGGLHPVFLAALQGAIIKSEQGDYRGALSDARALEPLALQVAQEWPALFHVYLNTIVVALIGDGRPEEAARFCETLRTSRFRHLYPEWGRTGDEVDLALRKGTRLIIAVSQIIAGAEGKPSAIAPADPLPQADDLALAPSAIAPADPLPQADDLALAPSVDRAAKADIDRAVEADPGERSQAEMLPLSKDPVSEPAPLGKEPVRKPARPDVKPRARTRRAPSVFLATQSFIRLINQQARVGMGKRNPARSKTVRWSNVRRYPARPRAP
jgi:hypothetical protein